MEQATGLRLALIRERLHGGISQTEFAHRLGVSQARYNHWERGFSIPTDQVRKIKDITPGITADWLYWGDTSALTFQVWWKLYGTEEAD